MGISGIYAFTNTSTSTVKNDLNTGAVNIQLKEYSINNNVEQEYTEDPKTVMPGEVVSLIPRVLNLGESCYVRAKISYKSNENESDKNEEEIIQSTINNEEKTDKKEDDEEEEEEIGKIIFDGRNDQNYIKLTLSLFALLHFTLC